MVKASGWETPSALSLKVYERCPYTYIFNV